MEPACNSLQWGFRADKRLDGSGTSWEPKWDSFIEPTVHAAGSIWNSQQPATLFVLLQRLDAMCSGICHHGECLCLDGLLLIPGC